MPQSSKRCCRRCYKTTCNCRLDPRPTYSKRYGTVGNGWSQLSKAYLSDNPLCEDCQQWGRVTEAKEVHHKIKHCGDPELLYQWSNLVALCKRCHSKRTAMGE